METDTLTAWATVAAVVVALFGPVCFEAYRRRQYAPKLTLAVDEHEGLYNPPGATQHAIGCELTNAPKRHTALDVRVFVTGTGHHPNYDFGWVLGQGTPLRLEDGASMTVPPNFSRRFVFGWIQRDPEVRDTADVGLLNTADASLGPLKVGFKYDILIAVAGSNFDATYWRGELTVTEKPPHEGTKWVRAAWTRRPTRVSTRSL